MSLTIEWVSCMVKSRAFASAAVMYLFNPDALPQDSGRHAHRRHHCATVHMYNGPLRRIIQVRTPPPESILMVGKRKIMLKL
jgi:hypothetical protein